MSMKLLTAIGAMTGLGLLGSAQSNPQADKSVQHEATCVAPCVWLSSELVGMNVLSSEGEKLGKIEDIVVHPGGEVAYAVLSFGGWMGVGDKLFAMPWTVLRPMEPDATKKDSQRALVLPVTKERLKSAPGFDKQSWPTMANIFPLIPCWFNGVRRLWEQWPPTREGRAGTAMVACEIFF